MYAQYSNPKDLTSKYFIDNSSSTEEKKRLMPLASISKSITGTAAVLFAMDHPNFFSEDGKSPDKISLNISIKELVNKKIQELEKADIQIRGTKLGKLKKFQMLFEKRKDVGSITLAQLLNHTSPIISTSDDYALYKDNPEKMKIFERDKELFEQHFALHTQASRNGTNQQTFDRTLDSDGKPPFYRDIDSLLDTLEYSISNQKIPGQGFSYNNFGYGIGSEILSLLSDRESFVDEIQERITKRLGFNNEVLRPYYELAPNERGTIPEPYGTTKNIYDGGDIIGLVTVCEGGFCSTIDFLEKYSQELAKMYEGKASLLTNNSILAKQIFSTAAHMVEMDSMNNYSCGLIRGTNKDGTATYKHGGSLPGIDNDMRISISRTSEVLPGEIKLTSTEPLIKSFKGRIFGTKDSIIKELDKEQNGKEIDLWKKISNIDISNFIVKNFFNDNKPKLSEIRDVLNDKEKLKLFAQQIKEMAVSREVSTIKLDEGMQDEPKSHVEMITNQQKTSINTLPDK